MRLSPSVGLLAFAASASAFADTSPFVLFSTAEFKQPFPNDQVQTAEQVLGSARAILDSCPTEQYRLVIQPNANAADIRGPQGCKVPNLCSAVADDRVKSTFSVAEVVGELKTNDLAAYIQTACQKMGKKSNVLETRLPALPTTDRAAQLADNDHVFGEMVKEIQSTEPYTILYLTSSVEPTYEADFGNSISDELRKLRARGVPVATRDDNQTTWDKRPLFEKYQFFTPGIFHAIIVVILLFAILGVGIRALASLEVSYAAFDKEMGPAAQKKQN